MTDVGAIFEKGIVLGPTINKDRYICPVTGAHFEWRDMCIRIQKAEKQRMFDPKYSSLGGKQTKKLNADLLNEKAVNDARKLQKEQQQQEKQVVNRKVEIIQDNTGNINNLRASQERHNTQPDYMPTEPNRGGNAVTQVTQLTEQDDEVHYPSTSNVKKSKEISSAINQSKMGQLIKMKSYNNARNGAGVDQYNGPNIKGNYQVQIAHTQGQHQDQRLNTDGDVQIGGSFDGRERVQDMIKSRHLAAKIPASKITYKQGPSIQKGGMKIPQRVGEQDSIENVYGDNSQEPAYAYRDASNSSNEENSVGNKSQHRQTRILTQPDESTNKPNLYALEAQNRALSQHSKTAGVTNKNSNMGPSKRLSQKSSARQIGVIQSKVQNGFSPGRNLKNGQGQSQMMNQNQQYQQSQNEMYYQDTRNGNELYVQEKHHSQGPIDKPVRYGNAAIQANATFHGGIGNHEQQMQGHHVKTRSLGGQAQMMAKTGSNFQYRMGQQKGRIVGVPQKQQSQKHMGQIKSGHRRQFSSGIQGVQTFANQNQNYMANKGQIVQNGVGMSNNDKRGRNKQGQNMFVPMGATSGGGSDMNIGSQNSMSYHQRNQTQINPPAAESVFRSSIMSNEQTAKNIQVQKTGLVMNRSGPQRFSANQKKANQAYAPTQQQMLVQATSHISNNIKRVQSGSNGRTQMSNAALNNQQQQRYLQTDGSQGNQGQQDGLRVQAMPVLNGGASTEYRRPSGKISGLAQTQPRQVGVGNPHSPKKSNYLNQKDSQAHLQAKWRQSQQ